MRQPAVQLAIANIYSKSIAMIVAHQYHIAMCACQPIHQKVKRKLQLRTIAVN